MKLFEMFILATSPACIVFKTLPKCPHPLLVSTFHTHPHASLSTVCLLYTSPSPRDRQKSRMPSSA